MKHTQSENGSVTMTSPHEMAVRSQPHRPMPVSDSSAAIEKTKEKKVVKNVVRVIITSRSNLVYKDAAVL